ncbi:MAG: hypothetical protein A2351_02855 [Omnitrophica bacterium RIFOXYB12_FULL_50_7]|nr:MAG: hypothetical protein A2351_02855 [Omnitrophica bacterium RIFOXYB12_FULL_50_7]
MDTLIFAVLLCVGAILRLGLALIYRSRRKHYANVLQGLGFDPVKVPELRVALVHCQPSFFRFKSIFFRGCFNGAELVFFDFWGNHWNFSSLPVVALKLSDSKIPAFRFTTGSNPLFLLEGYTQKDDVVLASAPHFSINHILRSPDRQGVTALFSQKVIEFFNKNSEWSVETNSRWMLVYARRGFTRFDLTAARDIFEKALQIRQFFS